VICKQFVECAKQRGGADNITCIVLRATSGVDGPPSLT
jgi:serine/threonine protein phosphatase PrpC